MTKEEMLEQLKHDRDLCNFNPSTGESEPISEDCRKSAKALDMAIKLIERQPSDDCVSRQAVIGTIFTECTGDKLDIDFAKVLLLQRAIKALPPVTPTHGTCKDCKRSHELSKGSIVCDKLSCIGVEKDFYCADYEKRGNENGSN